MSKTSRSYRKPYNIKKKKKSILKSKYLWFFIAGFFVFLGIFYLICFSPWIQIKTINVSGNEEISSETINGIVKEQIETRILLIKTKSIFFVSPKNIQTSLLEVFPKIDNVKVTRKLLSGLNISIEEKGPSAVFCRKDNCFFIDNQGIAFKKAENKDNLVEIIDNTKEEIFLKEKVIKKDILDNILKIDNVLKTELSINVESYSLSSEKMTAKVSEGWSIFFKSEEKIDWQLTKLKVVLEKEISLDKRSNLEYIELRFGNLAPYKYN